MDGKGFYIHQCKWILPSRRPQEKFPSRICNCIIYGPILQFIFAVIAQTVKCGKGQLTIKASCNEEADKGLSLRCWEHRSPALGSQNILNVSHIRYLVALVVKKIDNSHDLINFSSFLEYISRTLFHSRKGNIRRRFRSNQGSNFHFFSISILTRFEIPSDQGSPISCDAWFWGLYSYGLGVHFKVSKLQF